MKNVINKIQNSKGFVSIESILVIGAVVILAGLIIWFFNGRADAIKEGANKQTTEAQSKIQGADGKDTGNTPTMTFTTPPATP